MERLIETCCPPPGQKRSLKYIFCWWLLFVSALLMVNNGQAAEKIDLIGLTTAQNSKLPAYWQPFNFPTISSTTNYKIVHDADYGPVVLAQSSSGAGGIFRSISVDPRKFPLLNWSWKIQETLPGSSLLHKSGDDFPVRVMISFQTEGSGRKGLRDNILCYVWASEDSVDSVAVNPIHRHIMTVVAASGNTHSGAWLELSRNIVDDYRQAFSAEPGRVIGVALMTDSDNTGSEVRAWYGPAWLKSVSESAPPSEPKR